VLGPLSQYYETFILIQWDGCPNTMRQTLSLFQNSETKLHLYRCCFYYGTDSSFYVCLVT